MERYTELTNDQLARLTSKQIDLLIELEVAHAAIEPVMPPVKPSLERVGITKSAIAYQVNNILFVNEDDALTVANMSMVAETYEYETGYKYKWLKPVMDPSVSKVSYYRQEDVVRVQAALVDNNAKLATYEPAVNAYNKFMKQTGEVRNNVRAAVSEALEVQKELTMAQEQYKRYLILAGDDKEIADNFFRNTYKHKAHILTTVLGDEDED